jgi:hypothetical protein
MLVLQPRGAAHTGQVGRVQSLRDDALDVGWLRRSATNVQDLLELEAELPIFSVRTA